MPKKLDLLGQWALPEEQSRNRRNTVWLAFEGKTLDLKSWSNQTGIKSKTLQMRVLRGWDAERVLARPVGRWI
jgi:hypothetical protein